MHEGGKPVVRGSPARSGSPVEIRERTSVLNFFVPDPESLIEF